MRTSFDEAVAKARVIERAVAQWLMAHGARILPVYDYSGLGENKAPRLEAFSASDSLVTPDLLVARSGRMQWCEVKWKERAFEFMKTNEYETGIDLRLWKQYQRVKTVTGCRVFLVFAHKQENIVTCDEIGAMDSLPGKRVYMGSQYKSMINWPLRHLHQLTEYARIIPSEAA